MTQINSNDLHFLVALLASEESLVSELETDLAQRDCERQNILDVLIGLVSDGTVGITKAVAEDYHDFEQHESLALCTNWSVLVNSKYQLYLTEKGWERWEVDDWGITTERAHKLMFSNEGSNFRVKG